MNTTKRKHTDILILPQ